MTKECKQTNDLRKEFIDELLDVMWKLNAKAQTSGEETLMNELALAFYETVEFSNEDGEVIDILERGEADDQRTSKLQASYKQVKK